MAEDENLSSGHLSDSGSEIGGLQIALEEEETNSEKISSEKFDDESVTIDDSSDTLNGSNTQGETEEIMREEIKEEEASLLEKLSADLAKDEKFTPDEKPKDNNNKKSTFSWENYLLDTGGTPAPSVNFFQNPMPPVNKFEEDKKIEMPDPRGSGGLCLATIEQVYGMWILVRLCGCDDANDQWVMCDDRDIHAIGFAAKHQGDLHPPIGYRHNLAKFRQFLDTQLCGDDVAANEECFKPIPRSMRPTENQFSVGQKVEAVDYKNFTGSMFPATVVRVIGDDVEINFDGYTLGYNMRVRHDSRCLFPVGWAEKAGLSVTQPPRPKGKIKRLTAASVSPPSSSKPKPVTSSKPKPRAPDGEYTADPARKGKGARLDELIGKLTDTSTGPRKTKKRDTSLEPPAKRQKTEKPELSVARKTLAPPKMNVPAKAAPSSASSSTHTGARARKSFVAKPPKKTSPSARRRSETPPKAQQSHIPPDIVLASDDGTEPEGLKMTVYVHRGCACGTWLDPDKLSTNAPLRIGPANLNHVVREAVQTIVNCALDTRAAFQKIEAGPSRIMSITADIGGRTHVRSLPSFKDLRVAWSYLGSYLDKLGSCRSLLSRVDRPCVHCSPPETEQKRKGKRSRRNSSGSSDGGGSTITERDGSSMALSPRGERDVAEWSVEEVAEAFESLGDTSIPNAFRNADIDGKALMLLSPEHVIKHMNIRLGPALKIYEQIEHLKGSKFGD